MVNENLTIERVLQGGETGLTLYKLSNGDIVNINEAINFAKQGKLQGIVIGKDERGQECIKSTGHEYEDTYR